MEAKNTVVIFGTEAFARGEMVNLALSTGALVLERTTGNYSPRGCYLTPVLPFSAFDRLMVSWGADTPRGTSLEAEVRVFCGDKWSGWYGFGRWSPFVSRAGVHQPEADNGTYRIYGPEEEFLALGRVEQGKLHIIKSFFDPT